VLRKVVKEVMFLVHWSTRLSLYGDTLDMPYIREYICGVSNRLGVIVYDALIGNVDVVRILRSTCQWPGNTPDWRRYILTMAFRLVMAGSGWDPSILQRMII